MLNKQGNIYETFIKKEKKRISENFTDGPIDRLNDYEEREIDKDEKMLLQKQSKLATMHNNFMEKHDNMLLETSDCVKRCQNAKSKQNLSKKELNVQKRSCLAGCGVYTAALDSHDKFDGEYTNDNGEHEIDTCPTLRKYAEAPPPTKIIGDRCSTSKECFSFKCGGPEDGECKNKCYVEGKSSSSFSKLYEGEGNRKTFCGSNISRLTPNTLYNFYFRTGTTWNLIEDYFTTLQPIKYCVKIPRSAINSILDVYGSRCYGILHKKGSKYFSLLEDPNNGVPKPSWNHIKKKLLFAGGREKQGDSDVVLFDKKGHLWKQIGGLLHWCGGNSKCNLCFKKVKGDSPLDLSRYKNTRMVGSWIRGNSRIDKVAMKSNGDLILISGDDGWTKMVSYNPRVSYGNVGRGYPFSDNGNARYYRGNPSEFTMNKWNSARSAFIFFFGNAYELRGIPLEATDPPDKIYGGLYKCAYEKPDFPFHLLLNEIDPKYVKSDYARATWYWYPNYRGIQQWPSWWGRNWLNSLGVVFGDWTSVTPISSYQGRGKKGAEYACNQSEECMGFFESNPNQYHMLFPGSGKYISRGYGKNVKNIYLKDGSNIPNPERGGSTGRNSNIKRPGWWWSWWESRGGESEYKKRRAALSKGFCGSKGSLDKYVGRVDSVSQCALKCNNSKLEFAGIGAGKYCYCGNNYWKNGMQSDCTQKCKNGSICGGNRGVNMYYSGYSGTGGSSLEYLDGPPKNSSVRQFSRSRFSKPKDKGVCPPDQSYIEFFSNQKNIEKDYSHLKILFGVGGIATAYYLIKK